MLKGNVLIVDDMDDICDSVKSLINEEFPEVRVFVSKNVDEAIEILKNDLINVVITDMVMDSEEAGYDLLRFMKEKKPLTQVIVLTAYPSIKNVVKCMRIGCFDYISKEEAMAFEQLIESTRKALELSNYPVDRQTLTERLILAYWNEMQRLKSTAKKGIALENLCSLILQKIPGWQQIESRVRTDTEEIDLVIINESKKEFWKNFGTLIMVECKNWSTKKKPGKNEFASFYAKITGRGEKDCRLGFFVSINGNARTFKIELQRIAKENIKIVVLEKDDLWGLVCAEDRSQFLKKLIVKQIL